MEQRVDDEVVYYYDVNPTQEDLVGETSFHSDLITYLTRVLRWLFRDQICAVYENLNFYQTANPREYPLAPDSAVSDISQTPKPFFSLSVPEGYGMIQEYFAYDPNFPLVVAATTGGSLAGNSILCRIG